MNTLTFDIPHFHLTIERITNTYYTLEVYHKETCKGREYDIKREKVKEIHLDSIDRRLIISFTDKTYLEFSFENDCVCGDLYDSSDIHLAIFSVYDFIND